MSQQNGAEELRMDAKKSDLEAGSATELVPVTIGATALAAMPEEETITREQRRSRRKRAVRARTISVKRMTKRELELGRMLYPESDY